MAEARLLCLSSKLRAGRPWELPGAIDGLVAARQLLLQEVYLSSVPGQEIDCNDSDNDYGNDNGNKRIANLLLVEVLLSEVTAPLALLLALDGSFRSLNTAAALLYADADLCRAAAVSIKTGKWERAEREYGREGLPCGAKSALRGARNVLGTVCGSDGNDDLGGSRDGTCIGVAMSGALEAAALHVLRADGLTTTRPVASSLDPTETGAERGTVALALARSMMASVPNGYVHELSNLMTELADPLVTRNAWRDAHWQQLGRIRDAGGEPTHLTRWDLGDVLDENGGRSGGDSDDDDAHLQFASLLAGLGAKREARRHVRSALTKRRLVELRAAPVTATTCTETAATALTYPSVVGVRLLREILLALVPAVLGGINSNWDVDKNEKRPVSSVEAAEVSTALRGVLRSVATDSFLDDPYDHGEKGDRRNRGSSESVSRSSVGWRGLLSSTLNPHDDLGVRWHFLLAYGGHHDQETTMRWVEKALRTLCPPLSYVTPHLTLRPQTPPTPDSISSPPSFSSHPLDGGATASFHVFPNYSSVLTSQSSSSSVVITRVGFISGHWRFHSVGRLLAGLIDALARQSAAVRYPSHQSRRESKKGGKLSYAELQHRFDVVLIHTAEDREEGKGSDHSSHGDVVSSIFAALAYDFHNKGSRGSVHFREEHLLHGDPPPAPSSSARRRFTLAEAQRAVGALRLDALVFGDVGMDPLCSFLAFARLAAIQICFWGHPVTTGLSSIDYFASSLLFEPLTITTRVSSSSSSLRASHSEQLVLLDGVNTHFTRPAAYKVPSKSPSLAQDLPKGILEYEELRRGALAVRWAVIKHLRGFPSAVAAAAMTTLPLRLYMCAQSPIKLHPAFDDVIAGILVAQDKDDLDRRIDGDDGDRGLLNAVVLLYNPRQPLAHQHLQSRLIAALRRHIVEGQRVLEIRGKWQGETADQVLLRLSRRLVFIDQVSAYASYMALQCAADVFLDPFPFGGGVTVLEALACPPRNDTEAAGAHGGAHGLPSSRSTKSSMAMGLSAISVVTAPPLQTVHNLAAGMLRHDNGGDGVGGDDYGGCRKEKDKGTIGSSPYPIRLQRGVLVSTAAQFIDEAVKAAAPPNTFEGKETVMEIMQQQQQDQRDTDALSSLWQSNEAASSWAVFLVNVAGAISAVAPQPRKRGRSDKKITGCVSRRRALEIQL